jgi:hypothetical protein
MRALAAAALVPLTALAIAACGSGNGSATAPAPHRQTASGSVAVSVANSRLGRILVGVAAAERLPKALDVVLGVQPLLAAGNPGDPRA